MRFQKTNSKINQSRSSESVQHTKTHFKIKDLLSRGAVSNLSSALIVGTMEERPPVPSQHHMMEDKEGLTKFYSSKILEEGGNIQHST